VSEPGRTTNPQRTVAPANGLEPRVSRLERWVCYGTRKNGRLCHHVLVTAIALGSGGFIEMTCPKCGTRHRRTVE
jgi:hypothetical protein